MADMSTFHFSLSISGLPYQRERESQFRKWFLGKVNHHLSVRELLSERRVAIPGAMWQMSVATLLGWVLALYEGWSIGTGIIFGLALSVASTVVLLRV